MDETSYQADGVLELAGSLVRSTPNRGMAALGWGMREVRREVSSPT
jgi:hypothetical protein